MNQYIVSYKIVDAQMVSASNEDDAKVFALEEVVGIYDCDEADIEVTSVKLI